MNCELCGESIPDNLKLCPECAVIGPQDIAGRRKKLKGPRFSITTVHGEYLTVFLVVDQLQPMEEQPAIVATFKDSQIAMKHCEALNARDNLNVINGH